MQQYYLILIRNTHEQGHGRFTSTTEELSLTISQQPEEQQTLTSKILELTPEKKTTDLIYQQNFRTTKDITELIQEITTKNQGLYSPQPTPNSYQAIFKMNALEQIYHLIP